MHIFLKLDLNLKHSTHKPQLVPCAGTHITAFCHQQVEVSGKPGWRRVDTKDREGMQGGWDERN